MEGSFAAPAVSRQEDARNSDSAISPAAAAAASGGGERRAESGRHSEHRRVARGVLVLPCGTSAAVWRRHTARWDAAAVAIAEGSRRSAVGSCTCLPGAAPAAGRRSRARTRKPRASRGQAGWGWERGGARCGVRRGRRTLGARPQARTRTHRSRLRSRPAPCLRHAAAAAAAVATAAAVAATALGRPARSRPSALWRRRRGGEVAGDVACCLSAPRLSLGCGAAAEGAGAGASSKPASSRARPEDQARGLAGTLTERAPAPASAAK